MGEPVSEGVVRIIGIDFGTSTSLIKVKTYENGKPVGAVELSDYVRFDGVNTTVPSVVCHAYGEYLVGHKALHNKEQGDYFTAFKLDLVSSDKGVREKAESLVTLFFGYLFEEYDNQRQHFSPCDSEITYVSYPAKWPEEVTDTMLKIAEKAGFLNVRGIDEPSAALHTVMIQQRKVLERLGLGSNYVLMIDMGAGTTDLALCRFVAREKNIEILSTWPQASGVSFGGREVDDALWSHVKLYLVNCGISKGINDSQFIPGCKTWKETSVSPALSKGKTVENCAYIATMLSMYGEHKAFPPVSRETFENLLKGYLCQFPDLINGLFDNTDEVSIEDVDLVILTGGHSQWYFVKEIVSGAITKFGEVNLTKIKAEPWRLIELSLPQETVGLGMVFQPIDDAEENSAMTDIQTLPAAITSKKRSPSTSSMDAVISTDDKSLRPSALSSLVKRGLSPITERVSLEKHQMSESANQQKLNSIDELLTRAFLFLEDGDFRKAKKQFELVHERDVKNSKAYVGKLCIELNVRHEAELPHKGGVNNPTSNAPLQSLTDCPNFQKALRFADKEYHAQLCGYEEAYQKRVALEKQNEADRREELRKAAVEKLYNESLKEMHLLSKWKQSTTSKGAMKVKESYTELLKNFETMLEHNDSESLAKECKDSISEYSDIASTLKQQEVATAKKGRFFMLIITGIYLFVLFLVIKPVADTLSDKGFGGWMVTVLSIHLLLALFSAAIGAVWGKLLKPNEEGKSCIIILISTGILHIVVLTTWTWASVLWGLIYLSVFFVLGGLSILPGIFVQSRFKV